MLRFAANLTMMYTEYPFLERFEAAAADGFHAVEYLFPYDYPARELARQLHAHGLRQVLINAPPGDWSAGERGLACLPGREGEFRDAVRRGLEYAGALDCPRVHVMAGIAASEVHQSKSRDIYVSNLAWTAAQAASGGIEILMEPINPIDMPGYFLNRQEEAHAIAVEIGAPNLKVQMDLYHCARVEGDVKAELLRYLPPGRKTTVGHVQIAGVPGRNEPDTGVLDYDPLFDLIEQANYDGWIGCEYRPKASTSDGLGWLRRRLDR
jgi:hydroxypyruvate isomerase